MVSTLRSPLPNRYYTCKSNIKLLLVGGLIESCRDQEVTKVPKQTWKYAGSLRKKLVYIG